MLMPHHLKLCSGYNIIACRICVPAQHGNESWSNKSVRCVMLCRGSVAWQHEMCQAQHVKIAAQYVHLPIQSVQTISAFLPGYTSARPALIEPASTAPAERSGLGWPGCRSSRRVSVSCSCCCATRWAALRLCTCFSCGDARSFNGLLNGLAEAVAGLLPAAKNCPKPCTR